MITSNNSIETLAAVKISNDIVTITETKSTKTKEKKNMKTAKSTKAVAPKAEVVTPEVKKVAKPEIVIKDLVLPKEITIKEMKTCVVITNNVGNKWYLKGHTLEITTPIPALADRTTTFSQEIIEKCHLGNVTCCIKGVADNKDLQSILKHFVKSAGVKKTAKVEEVKTVKKAAKAKKAAKVEAPVAEVPAATQELAVAA